MLICVKLKPIHFYMIITFLRTQFYANRQLQSIIGQQYKVNHRHLHISIRIQAPNPCILRPCNIPVISYHPSLDTDISWLCLYNVLLRVLLLLEPLVYLCHQLSFVLVSRPEEKLVEGFTEEADLLLASLLELDRRSFLLFHQAIQSFVLLGGVVRWSVNDFNLDKRGTFYLLLLFNWETVGEGDVGLYLVFGCTNEEFDSLG